MNSPFQLFRKAYSFIQNISLDVVFGAIAMAWLVAKSFRVEVIQEVYVILGLSVWVIYTLDHLLDARKIGDNARTRRHIFHQKYFGALAIGVIIAVGSIFLLCFRYLPDPTWNWGFAVAGFSGIHLILANVLSASKSKWLLKELGVAFNYTAGVFVPAASLKPELEYIDYFLFGLLLGVAIMNLIMYSFFDYRKDKKQGQMSIAIVLGVDNVKTVLYALSVALMSIGLLGLLYFPDANLYQLFFVCLMVCITMFYFLMILFIDTRYISESYRRVGDLVFMIPFVLLLF